jgi:hypothetical protein
VGAKLGPNHQQVAIFLERTSALPDASWKQVGKQIEAARAAYGWPEFSDLELASYRELGQKKANQLLAAIHKELRTVRSRQESHSASSAAYAIALAEFLTKSQFAANYAPFNELIPVADLGPGKAPILDAMPMSAWTRFVTRVIALEGPGWGKVTAAALMIQDLVGVEEIDAILQAATCSSTTPEEAIKILSDIDSIGREYEERVGGLYLRIGEMAKSEYFAPTRVANLSIGMDNFRLAASRAAIGLMSRNVLTPRQFAALYSPFAALIDVRSLEVG